MKKISLAFAILGVFVIFGMPLLAGAQGQPYQTTFLTNISTLDQLTGLLTKVASWFMTVVIAVSVIMFVLAGFTYVTSGGDDEKIKLAKNYLLYGVIGIAVALLAFAITSVVQNLLVSSH